MKIFLIELRNASFRVKIYYLWALCLFIAVPMLFINFEICRILSRISGVLCAMYYLPLAFDWIKKMRNKQ
jgi:hypothetical protein